MACISSTGSFRHGMRLRIVGGHLTVCLLDLSASSSGSGETSGGGESSDSSSSSSSSSGDAAVIIQRAAMPLSAASLIGGLKSPTGTAAQPAACSAPAGCAPARALAPRPAPSRPSLCAACAAHSQGQCYIKCRGARNHRSHRHAHAVVCGTVRCAAARRRCRSDLPAAALDRLAPLVSVRLASLSPRFAQRLRASLIGAEANLGEPLR